MTFLKYMMHIFYINDDIKNNNNIFQIHIEQILKYVVHIFLMCNEHFKKYKMIFKYMMNIFKYMLNIFWIAQWTFLKIQRRIFRNTLWRFF